MFVHALVVVALVALSRNAGLEHALYPLDGEAVASNTAPTLLREVGSALVGRWVADFNVTEDDPPFKKGSHVSLYETCDWRVDGKAVECTGEIGHQTWIRLVTWDAAAKQVVAFQANSDGSIIRGVWAKQGTSFMFRYTTVNRDGTAKRLARAVRDVVAALEAACF